MSRGSFILGTSTEKNHSFPIPFEMNARGFPGYQYVKSTWRLSCGLEDLINLLSWGVFCLISPLYPKAVVCLGWVCMLEISKVENWGFFDEIFQLKR